jgi:hypothetical protein
MDSGDDIAITNRNKNRQGAIKALPADHGLPNLKSCGLFTLGSERIIPGVAAIPTKLISRLHGEIEGLIVISIHQKHLGAIYQ